MLLYPLSRLVRRAAVMATVVMLSGCTLKEIDRMDRTARGNADSAQRINDSRSALTQSAVTWTDKPWVNLKPVEPGVTQDAKTLPACQITINRPDGMTLPELGQRITALCGLQVIITPDAFQSLMGSTGNQATQQITGSLPPPDDNGRVPLAQMGAQAARPATVNSPSNSVITGLKWQGDVRGLLDIAARLCAIAAINFPARKLRTTCRCSGQGMGPTC